jgi:hypothetical protein
MVAAGLVLKWSAVIESGAFRAVLADLPRPWREQEFICQRAARTANKRVERMVNL